MIVYDFDDVNQRALNYCLVNLYTNNQPTITEPKLTFCFIDNIHDPSLDYKL